MIGATGVSSVRSPESTSRSTPVPVTIFVHEPHTYRSSTFAARPECCEHGGGQSVKPDATLAETGLGPVRRVTEMEKEQLYLRASMSACQRERERERVRCSGKLLLVRERSGAARDSRRELAPHD